MMKLSEFKKTMKDVATEGTIAAQVAMETSVRPKIDAVTRKRGFKVASCLLLALCMTLNLGVLGFADITSRITTASEGILTFLQGLLISVGAVSLAVCGIVLLLGIGGQRASENAKSWAIRIAFGMAIVILAKPVVEWIHSAMGGTGGSGGGGGSGG